MTYRAALAVIAAVAAFSVTGAAAQAPVPPEPTEWVAAELLDTTVGLVPATWSRMAGDDVIVYTDPTGEVELTYDSVLNAGAPGDASAAIRTLRERLDGRGSALDGFEIVADVTPCCDRFAGFGADAARAEYTYVVDRTRWHVLVTMIHYPGADTTVEISLSTPEKYFSKLRPVGVYAVEHYDITS